LTASLRLPLWRVKTRWWRLAQGYCGGFYRSTERRQPGQELKAEVIYPADYAEPKLAGKTVSYNVEVKAIKKRIVPELTDEFAKELGQYESLADLESRIREHMTSRKRRSGKRDQRPALRRAHRAFCVRGA